MRRLPTRPSARTPLTLLAAASVGVAGLASAAPAGAASSRPDAVRAGASAAIPAYRYVAIGDEFASGEGAPSSVDAFDPGTCSRTALAWPRVLASQTKLSLAGTRAGVWSASRGHVACADATTAEVATKANHGESSQAWQARTTTPAPGLITVMIGARDAKLRETLRACYNVTGTACVDAVTKARAELADTLPGKLAGAYRAVRASAPNARVIVVGYPRIVTPSTSTNVCSDQSAENLAAMSGFAADLDAVTAATARRAGFEYISTLTAFAGHEMCSNGTGAALVNGMTFNGSGNLDPWAVYPTAEGQKVLAGTVLRYLQARPTLANRTPSAAFVYKRKAGTTNRVVLDASAAKDLDGTITSYVWTSRGKVIGRTKVITVSLGRAKTAVITLTVTDNRGGTASVTRTVSARYSSNR